MEAAKRLVAAFSDLAISLREEALESIAYIGQQSIPILLAGLSEVDGAVAAGCAEALRRQGLPKEAIDSAVQKLMQPQPSTWVVWLLGNLPRNEVGPLIADLQESAPSLHYAISVLWSFTESWIARRWELRPKATFPNE